MRPEETTGNVRSNFKMNRVARPLSPVRLPTEKIHFAALVAFLVLVFLMGGGSRYDIQSLVILRPLAILFIGYALISLQLTQLKSIRMPLILLAGLSSIMIIQLIPLPPEIWSLFPGRAIFAHIGELVGTEQLWRPLTLSPSRTLNSLLSLSIPFAALLLFQLQHRRYYPGILWIIVGLGVTSALLGLFQLGTSSQSALYLYEITNRGAPVGLFSNRNHHAIFLASLFPLVMNSLWLTRRDENYRSVLLLFVIAFVLFISPLLLAMGSRAGLGLMLVGLAIGAATLARHQSTIGAFLVRPAGKVAAAALLLAILVIFYFAFANSRSLAFDRFFDSSLSEGSRSEFLPYILRLTEIYFPVGSGFGTFEFVYRAIEAPELVRYSYLNQAHNDGLQILIEAGIAGLAVALIFLLWFIKRLVAAGRFFYVGEDFHTVARGTRIAYIATFSALIILLGSVMDYPLRTPSIMAYFAILCAWIANSQNSDNAEHG